jgi:hypothetical protein
MNDSVTELHKAAGRGDVERIRARLALGADANAEGDWENTPLSNAVCAGHVGVMETLAFINFKTCLAFPLT